jgi:hypothetical protein
MIIIVAEQGRLIMNKTAYCDLESLDTSFNNKPLYKCKYCGLTVGLEQPDTKIMCFKKLEDLAHQIHVNHTDNPNLKKPQHISEADNIGSILLDQIKQEAIDKAAKNTTENLCSTEEIDQRLSICNTCEYFKDNSCLLCGCTVVREVNHQNKLAHKDQKCPVDKWGTILPIQPY